MLRLLIILLFVYLAYMIMQYFSYMKEIPDAGFILFALIIYFLKPLVYLSMFFGKDPTRKYVPMKTEIKKKEKKFNQILEFIQVAWEKQGKILNNLGFQKR